MSNTVVLGDLELYDGNDCLKFDGSGWVDIGNTPAIYSRGDSITIVATVDIQSGSGGTVFALGAVATQAERKIQMWLDATEIYLTANGETQSTTNAPSGIVEIKVALNATHQELYVNDVLASSQPLGAYDQIDNYMEIGSRTQGTGFKLNKSCVSSVNIYSGYNSTQGELLASYIKSGDFGSATANIEPDPNSNKKFSYGGVTFV